MNRKHWRIFGVVQGCGIAATAAGIFLQFPTLWLLSLVVLLPGSLVAFPVFEPSNFGKDLPFWHLTTSAVMINVFLFIVASLIFARRQLLNGRLFAGLAAVTFLVAILGRLRILPVQNLYLTFGSVGYDAFYCELFIFLVCTLFGFAYLGIARLKERSLNPTSGLVGFILIAFASVVWMISSFVITDRSFRTDRLAILPFAAVGCFILGVVLATANVAWGVLRQDQTKPLGDGVQMK
jgi:hypothetical protein